MGRGGTSYGLKADKQAEEKLYDLLPGMELTPMNPAATSLKAATIKPGYTLASPASSAVASQLKQAVSLGQDLTTYTTYEGYPAFAVATRHTDGYGVF